MRVDGGAAANDVLMQYQSDFSAVVVERPTELESTARGAAMLAGVGAGLFPSGRDAAMMVKLDKLFQPEMQDVERRVHQARWNDALSRASSRLAPTKKTTGARSETEAEEDHV
jgi:glycerol kinase